LHDQLVLVKTIQAGQALPESLLRAMGQIDRGAEFLKLYGSTLTAGEFFSIMMSVDRFTENRMVDTLESQDSELAEWIKKQTFVFEDFIICEAPVLKLLMQKVDRRVLELALLSTSADIRQSFLAAMTPTEAEGLKAGMAKVDADSMGIRLAQEELIRTLQDLDMRGQIRFERPDAEGKGTFRFYLVA
jgi:flagellar motor switch protein FliG